MDQHSHPLLTIGIALTAGMASGVASMQDVDLRLAIVLKLISIVSFLIGAMYALWKWRKDYKLQNQVNEAVFNYKIKQEKAKQKEKK